LLRSRVRSGFFFSAFESKNDSPKKLSEEWFVVVSEIDNRWLTLGNGELSYVLMTVESRQLVRFVALCLESQEPFERCMP